jgi:hypothetical protein
MTDAIGLLYYTGANGDGESYHDFPTTLAQTSCIKTPPT